MDDVAEQWRSGDRAWRRLIGIAFRAEDRAADRADDEAAEAALGALDDIGLLRRVLDRAELQAVRRARAAGSSWAEIAVRVGTTRQAAWERWRELDSETTTSKAVMETALTEAAVATVRASAVRARGRGKIKVPRVVGLRADEARHRLEMIGLRAVGTDPEVDVLSRHFKVTAQYPDSGAPVPRGSVVRLWLQRGDDDGAGDREPRRPLPTSLTDHAPIEEEPSR